MKRFFMVLSFIAVCCTVNARVRSIRSTNKFYDRVSDEPMAVVLFYREDRQTKEDKALQKQINTLERSFERASDIKRYKYADLEFYKVNVAKRDLKQLQRDFNITQFPSIILLSNGLQWPNSGALVGFVDRHDIHTFIESHFGTLIEERVRFKQRERRRNRVRTSFSFDYGSPYYYPPYWSYTRPYWYGPGYGGVGFGIGFGR